MLDTISLDSMGRTVDHQDLLGKECRVGPQDILARLLVLILEELRHVPNGIVHQVSCGTLHFVLFSRHDIELTNLFWQNDPYSLLFL